MKARESTLVNYKIVWADGTTLEFKAEKDYLRGILPQSQFMLPYSELPCLVPMANVRYISQTIEKAEGK